MGTARAIIGRCPEPWRPLALHAMVLAVLVVVTALAGTRRDLATPGFVGAPFRGDGFLGGWCHYDCGWYVGIAEGGYHYAEGVQSSVAFFPGYPITIRAVGQVIGNIPVAGVLVTAVCGAAAFVVFHRWATARLGARNAGYAVVALAVYPYAWYLYGAVYGDALFLLAAVGAFALLEGDHPVLAGIAGAAATATRPVGVAVAVGLALVALERREALTFARGARPRLELRRLRRADFGVLLAPLGLVAWAAYLHARYGEPLLFSSVQKEWGQPSSPETWLKYDFFRALADHPASLYSFGLVVQATLALVTLAAVPAVARRLGAGYAAYVAVLVLIPVVGSRDLHGLGRYLLGAFPAFAVLGVTLADRPALAARLLPASAVALGVATGLFAKGYYLA